MNVTELKTRTDALVRDLGLARDASKQLVADLGERLQGQSVTAFHVNTISVALDELINDAAALVELVAVDGKPAAPAAVKRPAARKRR